MKRQRIRLASNEWGLRLMEQVAIEALGTRQDLVVEVTEHGGWWLLFAVVNDEVQVVGSANDMAEYSPAVKKWWKEANAQKFEHLPCIQR